MSVWMKRGFLSLAIFGLLAAAPAQAQKGPPVDMGMADEMRPVAPSGAVPGQYIIVLNEDVTNVRGVAAEMARDHGLGIQFIYTNALRGFAAQVPEGRLQALERDPRVDYIEQDQWGGIEVHGDSTNGTNPVVGIMRVNADMNANIDIDGADDLRVDVDVAVIDTGIDLAHPDLNVVGGINCASGNKFSVSCSGDGDAGHWHGTHVAGTIAALDDGHDVSLDGGMDVVGVAPGARLWAVRVLDNRGAGTAAQYIAGVDWVIGNGAIEVANSSLGYPHSDAICDAVERLAEAGVTHAVSAGNDESLVFKSPGDCVGIDETTGEAKEVVITVSAIADYNGEPGGGAAPNCDHGDGDLDDSLADFSNYGPLVDVTAPGVCVVSTYPNGYAWASGTSMSSPHVAGAAALLVASGMTDPATIKSTLQTEGNGGWTDDSLDGEVEPLIDVSNTDVFAPATVAVGDTDSPPVASAGPDQTVPDSDDADSEWVTLDGSESYDPDGGVITGYLWTEGATVLGEEAVVDVWLADGPHNITLAVTDDEGVSDSDEVAVTVESAGGGGDITLTVTGRKVRGTKYVDLDWTGTDGNGDVTVFRNGSVAFTTADDGEETDNLGKGGGTYTYQICESESGPCSNTATWVF